MLKKFFFWGRNKNKHSLINRLGVEPKRILDATFGILKGKLVDYENLSDKEFITVLGKLANIEWCYYTLNKVNVYVPSKKRWYYVWIYVELPYSIIQKRLIDMSEKGSSYCIK